MDDNYEITLKKLCCTCLSQDRKLFQLCRLTNGVNNLYLLLSYDSEAYREGFYKDTVNLFICWECRAVMGRLCRFRDQACIAQKQLSCLTDGRIDAKSLTTLTRLALHRQTETCCITAQEPDNFIDCGPQIKSDDDDLPLSELNTYSEDNDAQKMVEVETVGNKRVHKTKKKTAKKCYLLSEQELQEEREGIRLSSEYVQALYKCESCVECFKSQIDLDGHNYVHTKKEDHLQCNICLAYVPETSLEDHRVAHYRRYNKRKKGERKTALVMKPGSKPRRNQAMMDKKTPFGYLCTECNKYFDNKNKRWKHVQRHHREGFRCDACGKRFAFKNNLTRHMQVHSEGPHPREECPTCHKMIRTTLMKVHARIHSAREQFSCAECEKSFVSRASYEHHLKYSRAHAVIDVLKYKCETCDRGYRSRSELQDHVNYQHMGKTRHQCPVCGKALATRRCITRHVRRAHHGLKESAPNKICQQCGKAFRDKKGLREHEFTHTGERPLSCEYCGCTFRQSASLYTHRRRVHRVHAARRTVQLLDAKGK